MLKDSELSYLMSTELPPLGYQKRLGYRTDYNEVSRLFHIINRDVFHYQLPTPVLEVAPRCRKYWGICFGSDTHYNRRSYCKIRVMDKWFCKQWLITTLAHEMCHQYQWDVQGIFREYEGMERLMSHGPSFFKFRDELAQHGISLKRHHSQRKWFKHQNLFKA